MAYIDEVEEREGGKAQKVYYSVLIKAVENLDQVNAYSTLKEAVYLLIFTFEIIFFFLLHLLLRKYIE